MTAEPQVVHQDDTASSPLDSTPEHEIGPGPPDPPPQKRKGGRKPIYATSEERKQRNRQAQAAFRERRTEYIKHLEITLKQNEETLQALQQNSQNATDEVSRLRYKNALLERLLAEKGFDVDAELQATAESPLASPLDRPISGGPQNLQRPPVDPRVQLNGHTSAGARAAEFGRSQASPKSSTHVQTKQPAQRSARPAQLDPSFQVESPTTPDFSPRVRGHGHRQSWPHPLHTSMGDAFDNHHPTSSPFDIGPHHAHPDIRALTDYTANTSLNSSGPGRQPFAHGQMHGLGPEEISRPNASNNSAEHRRPAGLNASAPPHSTRGHAVYPMHSQRITEHDPYVTSPRSGGPMDSIYDIDDDHDIEIEPGFSASMVFPSQFAFSHRP